MHVERKSEFYILGSLIFFALFPILASSSARIIPPVFFAGVSSIIAAIAIFPYVIITKQLSFTAVFSCWKWLFLITLFNVIIPFILIFVGAGMTSAINASLLLKTELFFTLLFAVFIFHQTLTRNTLFGGMFVLIGAMGILLQSDFTFNKGDLLIVVGVMFYPFGNFFMKKLLATMSSSLLLFLRSLLGGTVLLAISALFENFSTLPSDIIVTHWKMFLLNGLIVLGISKIMWFEGFRHLDISKSIALLTAEPALNLLYAFLLLNEVPNSIQWVSAGVTTIGILFLTKRPSNRFAA